MVVNSNQTVMVVNNNVMGGPVGSEDAEVLRFATGAVLHQQWGASQQSYPVNLSETKSSRRPV